MRRPMVVANWKMYTGSADASILATTVRNYIASVEGIEVVLCPPSIWLSEIASIIGNSSKIQLGAQNIFHEPEGPFTGEISPMMVRDIAKYVIVGHSERREYFGENDFDVNEKVIASLKAGLYPIICVGEKKKSNQFPELAIKQLKEALKHVPKKFFKQIVVAYEPVWAIGTGENDEPAHTVKVINALREIVLRDSPILYGGSVDSRNVKLYQERPEIDGLLVGSSSLRASEFISICTSWSIAKSLRKEIIVEGSKDEASH